MGFSKGSLRLYPERMADRGVCWSVATAGYVITRLIGPAIECAEVADPIRGLAD